ncbi:phosphatidylethanolamine-binding protein [Melampsora americana]|nr:phosphatidylethanolamine-binding protein [Melampsora americana]
MFTLNHQSLIFISSFLITQSYSQVTNQQTNEVQSQFDTLKLSSQYPEGFGIPLKAQALLNVIYPTGNINLGQLYNKTDVATKPTISVTPLADSINNFKAPNAFTLVLTDANALGNPDPQLETFVHFLQNGATFGDPSQNNSMNLNEGSGTVVTSYVAPGPLLNSGLHRYAWLLFAQPSGFNAPANLSTANVGPGHWNFNAYVVGSGLGDLVASSFFTVHSIGNSTSNSTSSAKPNGNSASFAPGQFVNIFDLLKIVTSGFVCVTFLMV